MKALLTYSLFILALMLLSGCFGNGASYTDNSPNSQNDQQSETQDGNQQQALGDPDNNEDNTNSHSPDSPTGSNSANSDEPLKFVFKLAEVVDQSDWTLNGAAFEGGKLALAQQAIAESGSLTINDTVEKGEFARIEMRQNYIDPVVLAFITSRNGNESVDVRVRHVDDSFQLLMQEPDNESHAAEEISYVVVEKGRHELTKDLIIEAGSVDTTLVHREGENYNSSESIDFKKSFASSPVVLSRLNTFNNADFMTSHVFDVTEEGFQVVQEAAGSGSANVNETIAWVAATTGYGEFNGVAYEFGKGEDGVNNGVDDDSYLIDLVDFQVLPDIIVGILTAFGTDGGWVRSAASNQNPWSYFNFVEEDTVGDSERNHINEEFGWMALSQNSDLWAFYKKGTLKTDSIKVEGPSTLSGSKISWNFSENNIDGNQKTKVKVRTSLDGGETWTGWTTIENGAALPEISAGDNIENLLLKISLELNSGDRTSTPELTDFQIEVE